MARALSPDARRAQTVNATPPAPAVASSLLATVPAKDRTEVERLMTRVRNALTDRQWDRLTAANNELSDILFYLEDA